MKIGNSFDTQSTNYLNQNKTNTQQALAKIAATRELSGKDGADYLLSSSLSSQIATISQSIQNENNSIAIYQSADSTLRSVYEGANKLNELSAASNNAALNASQQEMLTQEFNATKDAMQSAFDTASYNGTPLFNSAQFDLQTPSLQSVSIDDQESIDTFMKNLDNLSSQVGANITRSEVGITNALSSLSNLTSSYANVSEEPMDNKINDLKINELKLESSMIVQAHQNDIAQQRVSALLV